MIRTALILGRTNGVGLDRDAQLLADALTTAGFSVTIPPIRSFAALISQKKTDVAFHLERISPLWKRKAAIHFLIPNQERFPERHIKRLRLVDHVLCKSEHARAIFSNLHPSTHLLSFTSPDRKIPNRNIDFNRFFHLAGRSTLKNTGRLLELWSRHPEWPTLTLVQHPDNAPKSVPSNVNLISRYLDDSELRELQNECGLHLCPSLSEGWGHYIVEAASCGAVILTTDAPPMNELVHADHGVLVPFSHSEPRHLGRNFDVDPQKLEAAIANLITLPLSEKQKLGESARCWFETNHANFCQNLSRLLAECR